MYDLQNVWNFDFMWDNFFFILKIVAPFVMIIVGILGTGLLLKMIVGAVKEARK
ncbi:PTS ascorbate transporter subunit IIC [Lysinibacillus xylanilyticus]|uniref:PTS ascorbate transporter subunit IIC n=1 Tax=Lysinibacillus xylanilyticus TaxID=582475 RepID=UPI00382E1DDF